MATQETRQLNASPELLLSSPHFQKHLEPTRELITAQADRLRAQGDDSVKVYRIASLDSLGGYLGGVSYVMLHGEQNGEYKSAAMSVTSDGWGTIQHSATHGLRKDGAFEFEPLWEEGVMDRASEALEYAVKTADYPHDEIMSKISHERSLATTHQKLAGINGMHEVALKDEDGNYVVTTELTVRLS